MLFVSGFLLLLVIFIQLIVGGFVMSKKIKFSFGWLTLMDAIFIAGVTLLMSYFLVPKIVGPHCGMDQLAINFLGLCALGLQLFVAILQLIWILAMKNKRESR